VLFVFDVDMLSVGNTGRLWVTKQNPTRWTRVGDRRYWFQDQDDLDENFVRGDFGQMILLRHCGGAATSPSGVANAGLGVAATTVGGRTKTGSG
jgi:hypothetical protein